MCELCIWAFCTNYLCGGHLHFVIRMDLHFSVNDHVRHFVTFYMCIYTYVGVRSSTLDVGSYEFQMLISLKSDPNDVTASFHLTRSHLRLTFRRDNDINTLLIIFTICMY